MGHGDVSGNKPSVINPLEFVARVAEYSASNNLSNSHMGIPFSLLWQHNQYLCSH